MRWLWILVYLASQALLFLGSSDGMVLDEGELDNPTIAWLLMHGQLAEFGELQRGSYAGGVLSPFLAMPALAVFGPRLWAWKLTVWAVNIGILVAGRAVAMTLRGRVAAEVFCACLVFAPLWFTDVSQHGVGSHHGCMLFVLLTVLSHLRGWPAWSTGLFAGLAITVSLTGAFVLVVLAFDRRQKGLVGLAPTVILRAIRPDGPLMYGRTLTDVVSPGHIADRVHLLFGPAWHQSLFEGPEGVLVSLLLLGGVAFCVGDGQRLLPALVGVFVVSFLVTSPDGSVLDYSGPLRPNAMRHAAPLVPLLALTFGCMVAVLSRHTPLVAGAAAVLGIGPGLSARLQAYAPPQRLALQRPALELTLVHDRPAFGVPPGSFYAAPPRFQATEAWMVRLEHERAGFHMGNGLVDATWLDVGRMSDWVGTLPDPASFYRGFAITAHRPFTERKLERMPEDQRVLLERGWLRLDPHRCQEPEGKPGCDAWSAGYVAALRALHEGLEIRWEGPVFAEGVGDYQGQTWGPDAEPVSVPDHLIEAWTRGRATGVAERFGPR